MDSGTKAQLYIELLNKYIYFAEKGLDGVSDELINELIERIREELPNLGKLNFLRKFKQNFLNFHTNLHFRNWK